MQGASGCKPLSKPLRHTAASEEKSLQGQRVRELVDVTFCFFHLVGVCICVCLPRAAMPFAANTGSFETWETKEVDLYYIMNIMICFSECREGGVLLVLLEIRVLASLKMKRCGAPS